jgi:alkanesulfonate monooxygenase SsuD/methylene tetrahydromethanopterin reductase-like flavin-dependent oxidoreductase (luciferase family)
VKIMPGVTLFIGRTRAEAQEQYDLLNGLVDPALGLSYLYSQFGDLTGHPVDGPVPEPASPLIKSMSKNLLALARREDLSIRQLYTRIAAGFAGRVLIGTARDIVDDMEAWVAGEAADGFNLCPPVLPLGLDEFVALVLPELRARHVPPRICRRDAAGEPRPRTAAQPLRRLSGPKSQK